MSKIEWGIFDHLDRRDGVGIAETYKDRLSIIEAYDKVSMATIWRNIMRRR